MSSPVGPDVAVALVLEQARRRRETVGHWDGRLVYWFVTEAGGSVLVRAPGSVDAETEGAGVESGGTRTPRRGLLSGDGRPPGHRPGRRGSGGVGSAQVLILAGEIACEVLTRYGSPTDAALTGVSAVETSPGGLHRRDGHDAAGAGGRGRLPPGRSGDLAVT